MDEPFIRLLKAEIAKKRRELERYEKALAMLELQESGRVVRKTHEPKRKYRQRLGNKRLEELRQAIRNIADNQDEFRQVDIRATNNMSSAQTALGFDQLRQEGMIRLSRKHGSNKYYRLTNEELNRNGQ
jgi:hypothetical protein